MEETAYMSMLQSIPDIHLRNIVAVSQSFGRIRRSWPMARQKLWEIRNFNGYSNNSRSGLQ